MTWPRPRLQTQAAALLGLGMVSIILLVVYGAVSGMAISAEHGRAGQAEALTVLNKDLVVSMLDEEREHRRYIRSGDAASQSAFLTTRSATDAVVAGLDQGTRGGPQQAAFRAVRDAVVAWHQWTDSEQPAGPSSGDPTSGPGISSRLLSEFRSADSHLAAELETQAARIDSEVRASSALSGQALEAAGAAVSLAMLLLMVLVFVRILRPVARLAQAASDLASGRSVEIPLQSRADEVEDLSAALRRLGALAAEREAHARHLEVVQELAMAASGMLDFDALSQLSVERSQEALGADSATLAGLDHGTGLLRRLADSRQVVRTTWKSGEGAIGKAYASQQPVLVDDYQTWAGGTHDTGSFPVAAALVVPLMVNEHPIGSLAVAWKTPRHIGPDEVQLLTLLASQVAPALEAARLHSELAESEERFRTLYQMMACGVLVLSPEGEILDANQAAGAILEKLEALLPGRPLLSPDGASLPLEDHPVLRVIATEQPVREVILGIQRAREVTWIQVDAVPIFDRSSGLTRIVISFIDITSHRKAVTARQESLAKSRFLATMSHELRTPLNSVLGFAQLLRSDRFGSLNERQARYVGHIESSGDHLLALITEVLDLSKIEAGQMEVMLERVPLDEVLADALARMGPQAHVKQVEFALHCEEPGLQIAADRRRYQQIVLNLLSNAVKFTPAGGSIELGARAGHSQIETWVRDTGVGIPPELQDTVFQDFTQIDSGRMPTQEGTGLGLAVSRRLAGLMGGTLRLESLAGEGCTFTVTLPRAGPHVMVAPNAEEVGAETPEIATGPARAR